MNSSAILNPSPVKRQDSETTSGAGTGSNYRVVLYDDDWHAIDDVVTQVQKATGYSASQATAIVVRVHHEGRGVCFRGDCDECHHVARVLREIRLQCEVDCD